RPRLQERRPPERAPRRGAVLRQADPPLRREVEGSGGLPRHRARAPRTRRGTSGDGGDEMTKKPALRRGPAALIPGAATPERGVQEVDVELRDASRHQPRRRFEESGLEELSSSIKESGVLQPVLVSREGERYRIIAGERRVRAARRAGLPRVPVLVREAVADRDRLLLALVESVQRRDLTPLEEAEAVAQLRDQFGLTQEEVASRVGKDRATVANALRLLKLPASVREAVDEGRLSAGHARPLLTLPSAADQEALAK